MRQYCTARASFVPPLTGISFSHAKSPSRTGFNRSCRCSCFSVAVRGFFICAPRPSLPSNSRSSRKISIAKLHTLGGDAVGEQGSVRWQSLNEFSARMSPASATYSLGQLVVAVVTVADNVSRIRSEEVSGIFSVSRGRIFKENVAVLFVFARAVYPHPRIGLRFLVRLAENLHHRLVCVDDRAAKQFFLHLYFVTVR